MNMSCSKTDLAVENGRRKTDEAKPSSDRRNFPITQIIAAIICNLGSLNCGMGIGWLSPAMPQMMAEFGVLSSLEPSVAHTLASWIAGAFPLAALVCTPLAALVAETLGRKTCGMAAGVPFMINSIIILTTNNAYHLLVGRFVMGVGVALAMGNIPTYIGETSEARIRGVLASLLTLTYTLGITASYLIGGFVSYRAGAGMMLVSAVLSTVLFLFMPETPAWLVRKGKIQKAADAIAWLWRVDVLDASVQSEMGRLQDAAKVAAPSRLQAARQLVVSKPLRRGFLLCLLTICIQGWMGMIVVHSYSVSIFLESGAADLTAEGAALVYGSIQIMGALAVTSLVERLGRKVLMTGSCFGVSVCMISMGIYFHLQSQAVDLTLVQWIPVLSLSMCVFTYTIGAGSVPFILISDLLTDEVRSIAGMVVVQVMFTNTFLLLRFYATASAYFGTHAIFYFFGVSGAVGGLGTIIFLPETKGRSTKEIQDILNR